MLSVVREAALPLEMELHTPWFLLEEFSDAEKLNCVGSWLVHSCLHSTASVTEIALRKCIILKPPSLCPSALF